ncbi:hypothetical protein H8S90_10150 [Olivibacter sp. SDN3]|nr:hypothetical protein H8S90_10150 [Olivibacter sp. SDN3]
MKILFFVLFLLFNSVCTNKKVSVSETKETVYLCGSGRGKKYHLSASCRGLSNCHYKTIKTTLAKAKKEGKTLCGWEN